MKIFNLGGNKMLLKILFAHSLGDYFLQSEYLAMNKGQMT